jgi:hypothetical protein
MRLTRSTLVKAVSRTSPVQSIAATLRESNHPLVTLNSEISQLEAAAYMDAPKRIPKPKPKKLIFNYSSENLLSTKLTTVATLRPSKDDITLS